MTAEQLVRDHLRRATDDVPVGPDLDTALRDGRRHRRNRQVGLAVATAAVVGIGAVGITALMTDGSTVVHDTPVAGAPAAPDFVPGTDIDEAMAAVVAERLPGLPDPENVYPSDTNHDGPLPDADFASATEWQAVYSLPDGGRLLVLMSLPVDPGQYSCPDCDAEAVPGGTVYTQTYHSLAPGEELHVDSDQTVGATGGQSNHGLVFAADDGRVVSAYERTDPGVDPTFTEGQLRAVVLDGRLSFSGDSRRTDESSGH